MLEQVLHYLHNWFVLPDGVHRGRFVIENGAIPLDFLREGQYFRILGSTFNDGLHRYGPDMSPLADEAFTGSVWALAVPRDVIELAGEIAAWQEKYGDALKSPYASESFGGYSYSKAAGVGESCGASWQGVFRGRLSPYKKLGGMK